MNPELEALLSRVVEGSSPASIGIQVVNLSSNPKSGLSLIAAAAGADPALAKKLLRTANSRLSGKCRKANNVREAVLFLGLNTTMLLALGAWLAKSFVPQTEGGVDGARIWRRALLSAVVASAIAQAKGHPREEETFVASLLQEVGILELDRSQPDFYAGLPEDADHEILKTYERKKIGADHAEVGARLLRHWEVPRFLSDAVGQSHLFDSIPFRSNVDRLYLSVAFSGVLCDALTAQEIPQGTLRQLQYGFDRLHITDNLFCSILDLIRAQLPQTEEIFEVSVMDPSEIDAIFDRALDTLMPRHLQRLQQLDRGDEGITDLERRGVELERVERIDALTGLLARGYLEEQLKKQFEQASTNHCPMTVLFIGLDGLKQVNYEYGFQAGNDVLVASAHLLESSARETDVVGRYGGTEFVVLLPGTNKEGAVVLSQRIVESLRQHVYQTGSNHIRVTASIGIASHSEENSFPDSEKLVHAASNAVNMAKKGGGNQVVVSDAYDEVATNPR